MDGLLMSSLSQKRILSTINPVAGDHRDRPMHKPDQNDLIGLISGVKKLEDPEWIHEVERLIKLGLVA